MRDWAPGDLAPSPLTGKLEMWLAGPPVGAGIARGLTSIGRRVRPRRNYRGLAPLGPSSRTEPAMARKSAATAG